MKKNKISKAVAITAAIIYPVVSSNAAAYANELTKTTQKNTDINTSNVNKETQNQVDNSNSQVQTQFKQESTNENKQKEVSNIKNQNTTSGEKVNKGEQQLNTTENNDQDYSQNQIVFNNVWSQSLGTLKINTKEKNFEFTGGWAETNPYLQGEAFTISLYGQNGEVVKSVVVNGNTHPETELANMFNGTSYKVGDFIKISFPNNVHSTKINITNFNGKASEEVGDILLKLTDTGVSEYKISITANPLQVLSPDVITSTNLTGTANPNNLVTANVDGKTFTGMSNDKGQYSIKVEDSEGFNKNTKVTVMQKGGLPINVTFADAPGITLQNDSITLNNVWSQSLGTIGFNPLTQEITFKGGWAGTNPYLSKNAEAFGIYLYNGDGSLINYEKINGSIYPESSLETLLNGKKFKFGDYIRVDYIQSAKLSAKINGQNININKDMIFKITKGGLEQASIQLLQVNPLAILGMSNTAPNEGTLTGVTNNSFENVQVKVGDKVFNGKSNENGEFSINITDSSGFTAETPISVFADGSLTKIIYPTVGKVGLQQSFIGISGGLYPDAYDQKVSFDTSNMTVNSGGNEFIAQLINSKTGEITGSNSGGDFVQVSGKPKLNGAKFNYGDIISVIESEQTNATIGTMKLGNPSGVTAFTTVNKFTNYVITPGGLVPLANKNLTVNPVLYKGENTVTVSGKTLPNKTLVIRYGNIQKDVNSDSEGNFSYDIPINDVNVGGEVSVYLNNENMENELVQYDTKVVNVGNNKIEIYNNDGFNVFNIGFNPVNDKLQVGKVFLTKTYAGMFYGNYLTVSLIDKNTGAVLSSYTGNRPGEIDEFVNALNNKSYQKDGIIEVSYNPEYIGTKVLNGNKNIGNTTGANEYFRITEKGLVNITDKFINVEPFSVLSGSKVTQGTLTGTVSPNEEVTVTVGNDKFTGKANDKGIFSINVKDENGFTQDTQLEVSANGYMVTSVKPSIEKGVGIANSFINFYQNNFEVSKLVSSVTFNPLTSKFVVNNYGDSFGDGKENYFTLGYYNGNGQKIWNQSFNDGGTSELSNFLNGKSFNYGDVISIQYNNNGDLARPVVLSNLNAIGNVSGQIQYFRITKNGLESINFGTQSQITNATLNGNNLDITANTDFSKGALNKDNTKIIIEDGNGNIDKTYNANVTSENSLTASIDLSSANLQKGQEYSFYVEINGTKEPLYVASSLPMSNIYNFGTTADNTLEVELTNYKVNINNGNDINTLLTNITSTISNSNSTVEEIVNSADSNNNLITASFINKIGESNLVSFVNENNSNKEFVNWVLNNKEAMEYFLEGYQTGEPIQALQIWENIWSTYGNSRNGFNLKMAIATALANTDTTPSAWPNYGPVGSPVQRYNIFETLNAQNGMLPVFRTLNVRLLEMVVGTPLPNDQIMMARRIIFQNHNGLINNTLRGLNNIAYTINYNGVNPHNGIGVFSPGFYPKNPNIADVWYDGGVCGATAQMGAVGPNVFGVPSKYVYQPGHVVFLYYLGKENTWQLGNNVFGWAQTDGPEISGWSKGIANSQYVGSYELLYSKAISMNLNESNQYLMVASLEKDTSKKLQAINEAITIDPYNLGAWLQKIDIMNKANSYTADDYINLANEIMSTFKDYPMPMFDTLLQIKQYILQRGTQAQYNTFVNNIQTTLENSKTQPQVSSTMLGLMPQYGLVLNQSKNLGAISINSWGTQGTLKLSFENNLINISDQHKWLGSEGNNSFLHMNMYSPDGSLIKRCDFTGTDFGDSTASSIPAQYVIGDIITIDYAPGSSANGSIDVTNMNGDSAATSNVCQYQITKDGLVKLGDTYKVDGKTFNFKNGEMVQEGINGAVIRLVNQGNQPIKNQKFKVNGKEETSNNEGEITLTGVKSSENVTISKSGYLTSTVTAYNDQIINATMSYSLADIYIKVLLPNGQPLANGQVNINGQAYTTNSSGEMVYETFPGENQKFVINVNGYILDNLNLNIPIGTTVMNETVNLVKNSYKIWGADNITVPFGKSFNPLNGVKVDSVPESDIKISGEVNVNKPGQYVLTYSVNHDGKQGTAQRTITVNDDYNLKINGANDESIAYGSTFNPLEGVSVIDPAQGGNPTLIVTSNNVNTEKPGTYEVSYKALDSYGTSTTITRKITVEKENVTIEASGFTNTTVNFGEEFNPLEGVSAKTSNNGAVNIKVVSGTVNRNKPGVYEIKYELSSGSLTTTEVRKITVNNDYKISLNGANTVNIPAGTTFDPMKGISVYDPAENSDVKIKVNGRVDVNKVGTYKVTYKVTDAYGKEDTVIRTININSDYKLTPVGFNNENIKFGTSFNAMSGLSVKDPVAGAKPEIKLVSGEVNTNKPGVYELKYELSDSNGKVMDVERTITVDNDYNIVIHAPKEEITFGGSFNPNENIVVVDPAKDANAKVSILSGADINTKAPGKYIVKYEVTDNYGKKVTFDRTIVVNDNYNINVSGINNETIKFGEKFDPLQGVKVEDPSIDNDVKVSVDGSVNVNNPGVYKLTYNITDAYGKKVSLTREVTVLNNYNITTDGFNNTEVNFGDKFDPMAGLKVNDPGDKNPTIKLLSGNVNTMKPGKYTLVYSVTDNQGRSIKLTREVTVKADYKISLDGIKNTEINFNSKFNPLEGIKIEDSAIDNDAKVTVEGTVNIEKPGTYTLIYSVKDAYGQTTMTKREVTVNNNYGITLAGANNETIKFGEKFNPLEGIKVEDPAVENNAKVTVDGTVNSEKPGTYKIDYSVKDAYGQMVKVEREITVNNDYNITASGINNETVKFGEKFNPLKGIKVEDPAIDNNVKISVDGSVNVNNPGVYKLTYNIIDAYGKKVSLTREITVLNDYNITTDGFNNTEVNFGDKFDPMEGLKVNDPGDKNPTIKLLSGNVNSMKPGKYTLVYIVSDSHGRVVKLTREVTVNNMYDIEVQGPKDIKIEVGTKFDPTKDIKVEDPAVDSDVKIQVVENNVNIDKAGTYKVILKASDAYGKTKIFEETVTVVEKSTSTGNKTDGTGTTGSSTKTGNKTDGTGTAGSTTNTGNKTDGTGTTGSSTKTGNKTDGTGTTGNSTNTGNKTDGTGTTGSSTNTGNKTDGTGTTGSTTNTGSKTDGTGTAGSSTNTGNKTDGTGTTGSTTNTGSKTDGTGTTGSTTNTGNKTDGTGTTGSTTNTGNKTDGTGSTVSGTNTGSKTDGTGTTGSSTNTGNKTDGTGTTVSIINTGSKTVEVSTGSNQGQIVENTGVLDIMDNGKPVSNAVIEYAVNNGPKIETTTDGQGKAKIEYSGKEGENVKIQANVKGQKQTTVSGKIENGKLKLDNNSTNENPNENSKVSTESGNKENTAVEEGLGGIAILAAIGGIIAAYRRKKKKDK
ncbi:MAG: immunoglobulin-like domain-containing protein [Clostridium sp.]